MKKMLCLLYSVLCLCGCGSASDPPTGNDDVVIDCSGNAELGYSVVGGSFIVNDSNTPVIVTSLGKSGCFSHDLYLDNTDMFLFSSGAVGTSVNIGTFPSGTELIFKLVVDNTGCSSYGSGGEYYSGPASMNPDGLFHAEIIKEAPGEYLFGFEDMFNGGDKDYDDCTFKLTGGVCIGEPNDPGVIIEKVIASADDDVEELENGVLIGSLDLELVTDVHNQTVGMRFTELDIPNGASIASAYIQFTADEASNEPTSLLIKGEVVDNATPFNYDESFNVSHRSTTNASVSWSPEAWENPGAAGANERTPDIKTILQEIINRPGWKDGNDIVIIITGSGERTAEACDGSIAKAPRLHVDYD